MATPNLATITTVTPKVLASSQLTAGTPFDTAVYTVASGKAAKIATCTLCNTSSAGVVVSVSIIPSGGTADGTHKSISSLTLGAGDTLKVVEIEGVWLGDGDKINVNAATASTIDCVVTGLEFS